MTMLDIRMSPKVEAGFSAIVGSNTRVTTMRNGHERRNAQWVGKKRRYTSRHAGWDRAMRAELLNHIEVVDGMEYSFRLKDWNDFSVTAQSLGAAPAGSTAVQLVKTYTSGAYSKSRTITKPVTATVVIYQAGIAKTCTVDGLTGLVTPSSAWTEGAALTWTGEFDVCVRFATDEPEFVLPHREICEVNSELVEVFGE